jgi:hypothetical protein
VKAADLTSQVEERTPPPDASVRAPDVEPPT